MATIIKLINISDSTQKILDKNKGYFNGRTNSKVVISIIHKFNQLESEHKELMAEKEKYRIRCNQFEHLVTNIQFHEKRKRDYIQEIRAFSEEETVP